MSFLRLLDLRHSVRDLNRLGTRNEWDDPQLEQEQKDEEMQNKKKKLNFPSKKKVKKGKNDKSNYFANFLNRTRTKK